MHHSHGSLTIGDNAQPSFEGSDGWAWDDDSNVGVQEEMGGIFWVFWLEVGGPRVWATEEERALWLLAGLQGAAPVCEMLYHV